MKAYKGFDKDLRCRGFQYEVGKTYTMPDGEAVKLCKSGFHACTNILDCFCYYKPSISRFCEVELDGVDAEKSEDSKVVAKSITIVRELTIEEVHDISQTEDGGNGSSLSGGYGSCLRGGDGSSLSGGDWSSLSGGDESSLRGGNWSSLRGGNESSLRGGYGSSLSGGDGSCLRGGDWSSLSGGDGSSLSGGNGSSLRGGNESSLRGGYGSSLSGGDGSCLRGGDWSSLRGGDGSRFCGKKDTVFASEFWIENNFIGMRVAIVDGETIKEDVWYELDEDGNWKESDICNE